MASPEPPPLTLARPASVAGVGLFTGAPCRVTISPAAAGLWISGGGEPAAATAERLSARPAHPAFAAMPSRSTGLDLPGGETVLTVEHLLSALAGLGVAAAAIAVEGGEIPIGDGSALAFVNAIDAAGLAPAAAPAPALAAPLEAFTVGGPSGPRITVAPAARTEMVYHLDYGPASPVRPQSASWDGSAAAYRRDIAPARTYCLDYEANAMRAAGLFGGFTPRDLLVIGPAGPIDNELRFADEPARHKLLDLIGDLALAGLPLPPLRVEAFGSGHALNHEAARVLRRAAGGRGTVPR